MPMSGFGQDVRYALRAMRRAPGFTLITLLLLTLGIGANTAVFAAVHGVLLRPLPYREPAELVYVRENGPTEISRGMRVGIPDFHDWRARSRAFTELAAYSVVAFNVAYGDETERAQAQVVSDNFARTLGVRPALGRFFAAEEDRPGAGRVAVVSHSFWQRVFGGHRDALGESIDLNGQPFTVVGVMPEGFVAPEAADVWIPMGFFTGPMLQWRANHMLEIVGRLREGTTLTQAEREINDVAQRIWASDRLMSAGWTLELTPLTDALVGPTRPALLLLLAAVAAVMLIVCANVASLMLARAASRRQELAVRIALGASLGRVARQLLTESGVIAALGALAGVVLAFAGSSAIRQLAAAQLPHFASLELDAAVLGYAVAIATLAALLFSAAPVAQLWRQHVALRNRRGGATDPGRTLLARLVAGEVAVSVTLLVLAMLLVSSFQRLMRADPGFTAGQVLTFRLTLPAVTYRAPSERLAAYERVRARLAALPGVSGVGLASSLPFSQPGERRSNSLFVQSRHADDRTGVLREDNDPNTVPKADVRYVDAGFFSTMGLRLVRGAILAAGADVSSEPQAVINRTSAERVFPHQDPIGQRIAVGSDPGTWRTIVGVVEDVSNRGLREAPVEEVFLSAQHFPLPSMAFLVRTGQDPSAMARTITREIATLLPGLPAYDVRTMRQRVTESIGVQQVAAVVMRALALVALVLAVSGLYGVLAYLVARRTHEFGIRMALGARERDVLAMLLGQAMRVVVLGVAVGTIASLGAARLISGQLYGVGTVEPAVLAGVAVTVLAASAIAALIPARRGSRVEPMVALRSE